jgi:hypothetical protein
VLVGTVGGIGAVFAQFVSPVIRAYNRISIYIAFLCLLVVLRRIDRLFPYGAGWTGKARVPVFAAVAAFGLWDQLPNTWFTPKPAEARATVAAAYQLDAAFFAAAEQAVPGATVFNLPFIAYPDCGYEHNRGYLHTTSLRFSYGAMKGREADEWARRVAIEPAPALLRRIVLRGFDAVLVDERQYNPFVTVPSAADFRAALGPGGPAPVVHADGRQFFFDLRPYRVGLKRALGDRYEAEARREAEQVSFLWLRGFDSDTRYGREYTYRWCGATGELVVVNPTDRTRTVRIAGTFVTKQASWVALRIDGEPLWADEFPFSAAGTRVERTLAIPPGRHRVALHARPADDLVIDAHGEVWRLTDFIAEEVEGR